MPHNWYPSSNEKPPTPPPPPPPKKPLKIIISCPQELYKKEGHYNGNRNHT